MGIAADSERLDLFALNLLAALRRGPHGELLIAALLVAGAIACSPAPSYQPSASSERQPSPSPEPSLVSPWPAALSRGGDWELLHDQAGGGEADTIQAVLSVGEFVDVWLRRFPGQVVPSTQFDRPLFVFFSIVVDPLCPDAVMDALVLDRADKLMYGVFTRDNAPPKSCGEVAAPHTFVVAVDRDALPTGQLTIRLELEFFVCPDCGRELEEVEVGL
jgi:hypothetical protein